ncbi:hypothetical protein ES702_05079 [subsurface metagenome]
MPIPKTEEYIFYQGERFQVEFYFTETARLPAKESLEKTSLQVKIKLAALVKYVADVGEILDIRKFRLVDRKERLYEFKPLGHRFFNFFCEGRKIIITNAYMKKSRRTDRNELRKAISMKKDYARRIKGGTYYGKKKS